MPAEKIRLAASVAEATRLNNWLDQQFALAATPQEVRERVKLSLSEWFANIISYGVKDPETALIEFSFEAEGCGVRVEMIDNGSPFDPRLAAEPMKITDVETAKIGGFGISLMKEAASELNYSRQQDNNCLELTFHPR